MDPDSPTPDSPKPTQVRIESQPISAADPLLSLAQVSVSDARATVAGKTTRAERWLPLLDVVTGAPPRFPTHFNLRHDRDSLILDLIAQTEMLRTRFSDRNAPLYEDDVVELFVDSLGSGLIYRELEISPAGVLFDARVFNQTDLTASARNVGAGSEGAERSLRLAFSDPRSEPQPSVQVLLDGREPDRGDSSRLARGLRVREWRVRLRLPMPWSDLADLADLTRKTDAANPTATPPIELRLNVFRIQRASIERGGPDPQSARDEFQAWCPTGRLDFHRPECFGSVVFSCEPPL